MTYELAKELDSLLNKAKIIDGVGCVFSGRTKEEERETALCHYLEVKYSWMERKGYCYYLTGLGIVEMEANNDAPFLSIIEKERKDKSKGVIVKVFDNGWKLFLAIVSGGAALEGIKWFFSFLKNHF